MIRVRVWPPNPSWLFAAACNFIEGGGISVEIVARKTVFTFIIIHSRVATKKHTYLDMLCIIKVFTGTSAGSLPLRSTRARTCQGDFITQEEDKQGPREPIARVKEISH
jgi:hypothetical protein